MRKIGRQARCGATLAVLTALISACGGQELTSTPTAPQITPQTSPSLTGDVTVFAASSLTDAFKEIGSALSTSGGKATFNFAGSQTLVTQLSQGAKADVFASADAKTMDAAVAAGVAESGTQKLLLTNKSVVITAPGGDKVTTLQDLAKSGVKVVLAAPAVPAGNYALLVLDNLSKQAAYGPAFKDKVLANVVSKEDNVRQVVAKVELGEADAGIVYITDANGSKAGKIEIPDEYNVIARYYIAPVKGAPKPQGASQFIQYVLSDDGQITLEKYGFGRADKANK